jgi:hypothetical protein
MMVNWRPRLQPLGILSADNPSTTRIRKAYAMSQFLGNDLGRIRIDHIVDGVHLALLHQYLDDIDGAFGHAVGKFLDGNGFRNDDFARHLFRRHLEALGLLLQPLGAALESGD